MQWALSQNRWAIQQPKARTQRMDSWGRLSERELIGLVLRGRDDAYGELVRRYQTTVYNIAYRLVGERQDALDLSQEAFVRAYQALDSFDVSRPLGPWLYRIVTNLTLNHLQLRRVPTVPLEPETGESPLPDDAAEPERVYLRGERQTQLRQAILALPPHYRAVIELRHFQELSYDEMAATLEIPLSDVKSHLHRARQLLRQWLEANA